MEEPVLLSPQVNKNYVIHCDASKYSNEKINLQHRIEEILDVATNPSNFKRIFNTGQVISIRKLLQGQKRDKFCR